MLHCTQNGIENQHCQNNDGAFHTACQSGNDGCDNQNHNQQVSKLFCKYLQNAFALAFLQFVVAVLFQPFFGFFRCQPVHGAVHLLQEFFLR